MVFRQEKRLLRETFRNQGTVKTQFHLYYLSNHKLEICNKKEFYMNTSGVKQKMYKAQQPVYFLMQTERKEGRRC